MLTPRPGLKAHRDLFDIIEALVIKGGPPVEVLNATGLRGGMVRSGPTAGVRSQAGC